MTTSAEFEKLAHQVSLLQASVHILLRTTSTPATAVLLERIFEQYQAELLASHGSDETLEYVQLLSQELLAASRFSS